ncbi:Uncharacterised protein [Bordetella pertussis]|nr:Uncharacterised protein [Bordetella pertussis]
MVIRHGRHQLQPYLGILLNRLGGKRGRLQVRIDQVCAVIRSHQRAQIHAHLLR